MIDPATAIVLYIVFLYSTVCHEAAHAWLAHKLGDDTAYRGGQVSLDPIPHIKRAPLGMVVLPLIMLLTSGMLIGWGLAPYNPEWARRNPTKDAWVAVAGPLANLLLIVLSAITIRVCIAQGVFVPSSNSFAQAASGAGPGAQALAMTVGAIFGLNLVLFVLNLLPLPPLDGSKIPLFFLRGDAANRYQELLQNPTLGLVTFLIIFNCLGPILGPIQVLAHSILYSGG